MTYPSASPLKPSAARLPFLVRPFLSLAFSNTQRIPFMRHLRHDSLVGSLSHRFFPFRPSANQSLPDSASPQRPTSDACLAPPLRCRSSHSVGIHGVTLDVLHVSRCLSSAAVALVTASTSIPIAVSRTLVLRSTSRICIQVVQAGPAIGAVRALQDPVQPLSWVGISPA